MLRKPTSQPIKSKTKTGTMPVFQLIICIISPLITEKLWTKKHNLFIITIRKKQSFLERKVVFACTLPLGE